MFHIILFRLVLFIAVSIIIYSLVKYFTDPERKLEKARNQGDFFVLDEPDNIRKNLLLTYNRAIFEGEKFLGTAGGTFEVTSIMVWTDDIDELHGMNIRDFSFIEKELKLRYPKAEIQWRSPVKEWIKRLQQKNSSE